MRTERMETQQGKVKQESSQLNTSKVSSQEDTILGTFFGSIYLFAVKWDKGVDVFVPVFFFFKYSDLK